MTNFEAIKAMDEYQIIKYFGGAICDRFVYNHRACVRKVDGTPNCAKCLATWLDEEVSEE